ncbi:unnamed protein product [Amaranthus hypochondriacus]
MDQAIESHGPYGSILRENYRVLLGAGEHITEITIRYGHIVDAIEFVIAKRDGRITNEKFGDGGGKKSKIVLQDGEYITRISGKYGYDRGRNKEEIASLKIHTNLCMEGYGPYGQGLDVETAYEFSSPILINKRIIGFFGRHNNVLESIGVLLQKRNLIESYGPYGSKLPNNFCMQLEDGERITKIKLTHGWIMDSIGFVIAKPGKDFANVNFGGVGGSQSEITLRNGEYLIRISGTYGYDKGRKQDEIGSLKIHTNLCPAGYGPYGLALDVETAYDFSSPHLIDGPIVGVFGRSNNHLESIGVLSKKGRVIESYGPYGSHLQQNYCMQVKDGERIIEVRISHGYIVDAIGFVIYDSRVCSTRIAKSGGDSQEEAKITLKEGEYLTRISGTYGNNKHKKNDCVIATLKIHTNLCLGGYGAFGLGTDVDIVSDFSSPILNDSPIVGIFGRSNTHVESIGVLIKKEFLSSS